MNLEQIAEIAVEVRVKVGVAKAAVVENNGAVVVNRNVRHMVERLRVIGFVNFTIVQL